MSSKKRRAYFNDDWDWPDILTVKCKACGFLIKADSTDEVYAIAYKHDEEKHPGRFR